MDPLTEQSKEETIFDQAEFSMEGYDKHIKNARIMLFAQDMTNTFGRKDKE